ncbi:MAG: DMT family transporter [Burkholderiales bacterium]|nr:DMT family transporter [Burkholderiales bacterium]
MTPPTPTPAQHKTGIATMVLCALLWSIAGLLTRESSVANGWEVTFWRSGFLAAFIVAVLAARHRADALRRVAAMGWPGLVSGVAWAVMFTCFMLALTRTTVANTLFIMGVLPFCTAAAGWLFLRERVPPRTWLAMAAAALGIGVMFGDALNTGNLEGSLIAAAVPLAAAANYVAVKRGGGRVDFIAALALGGLLSMLVTSPLAYPFSAGGTDLALFATLGVFQLGVPGILYVMIAVPRLSAAEVGLLSLLEVIFGPLWVWLSRGETPSALALAGGAIVIAALAVNESIGLALERRAARRGVQRGARRIAAP